MRVLLRGAVFLSLLLAMIASEIQAQSSGARKIPVKIIYSALTASNGPVWVAGDQGLFAKYGLDVQIVHGRGAALILALAGGTPVSSKLLTGARNFVSKVENPAAPV